jgi:hypothetical protein
MNAVIVGFALVLAGVFVRGLLADEIRGWVNRFPGWLLRQAAKQLGPDQQAIYDELWLPDLEYILHEDRPITRLVKAARMAAGLLVSTRREARAYRRAVVEETVTAEMSTGAAAMIATTSVPLKPGEVIFHITSDGDEWAPPSYVSDVDAGRHSPH